MKPEKGGENMDDQMLTVAEIADYLRLSKLAIYQMIEDRKIDALRIGGRWLRVPKTALEQYVKANLISKGGEMKNRMGASR